MNLDSQLTSKADHSPPSSDSTFSHELATHAARSAARSGSPVTALPAAIARSDNLFLRILPYGFNSSSYKLVTASNTSPSVGTGTAALALFLDFVFLGTLATAVPESSESLCVNTLAFFLPFASSILSDALA